MGLPRYIQLCHGARAPHSIIFTSEARRRIAFNASTFLNLWETYRICFALNRFTHRAKLTSNSHELQADVIKNVRVMQYKKTGSISCYLQLDVAHLPSLFSGQFRRQNPAQTRLMRPNSSRILDRALLGLKRLVSI